MKTRVADWMSGAASALLLGACTATPPPKSIAPAPSSVADLSAAVAADSQKSDAAGDAHAREDLAADAETKAQACLQIDPQAAACLYSRALALGLQARAHPLRANELLKTMLEALNAAAGADPQYDHAGAERVKALVLARAPGWPLGPGDADAAVTAARRAVQLEPHYPPNWLALAEALSKTGDAAAARENYQRAHDLAQAAGDAAARDDWLKQAQQGLRR